MCARFTQQLPSEEICDLYSVRGTPLPPLPALLEVVREPYCGPFERRPVSSRVNRVRNDDPDVLLPVPESELF